MTGCVRGLREKVSVSRPRQHQWGNPIQTILPTRSEARGTRRLTVQQAQSSQIRWLTLTSIVLSRSIKKRAISGGGGGWNALLFVETAKKPRRLRNFEQGAR